VPATRQVLRAAAAAWAGVGARPARLGLSLDLDLGRAHDRRGRRMRRRRHPTRSADGTSARRQHSQAHRPVIGLRRAARRARVCRSARADRSRPPC
jgi:hypothetical protein